MCIMSFHLYTVPVLISLSQLTQPRSQGLTTTNTHIISSGRGSASVILLHVSSHLEAQAEAIVLHGIPSSMVEEKQV